jgi:hypothetical protein
MFVGGREKKKKKRAWEKGENKNHHSSPNSRTTGRGRPHKEERGLYLERGERLSLQR